VEKYVDCQNLTFSGHAIRQMFLRRISESDVQSVVAYGEVIEDYPDDNPFPSCLLLDFVKGMPIHVVLSYDVETSSCCVVTAYVPDPKIWDDSFRSRR
jgi:hypothetical protein